LTLKLAVLTESVQVWLHTIRLASPTKLAQGENTVGGEMVKLHLESFQHLSKEPHVQKAKDIGEEVLENNGISSTRLGNCLTLRRLRLSLRNIALLL
jgi:hypothetical protein